jgi:hypothetical protein
MHAALLARRFVMGQNQNQGVSPFADFPRDNSDLRSHFAKAADRIVRIDVDGLTYIQLGSAIAHYGDIKFKRLPPLKMKGIEQKALGF